MTPKQQDDTLQEVIRLPHLSRLYIKAVFLLQIRIAFVSPVMLSLTYPHGKLKIKQPYPADLASA